VPTPVDDPSVASAEEATAVKPWPRVFAEDAWLAVVEELKSGAELPSVPKSSATHSQAQALVKAKTLPQRLSLGSTDPKLGQSLARLYAENLFPDRARAVLGRTLVQDPENLLTLKLAAVSLNASGRFEDGTAILEYLTTVTPNDQGLAGPLFGGYWELDELDAAEMALERGLEIAPFNANLEVGLGRVLFEQGRSEEAATHLKTAATGLPSDTEAWYRYATCLDELGRAEEAAAAGARHSRLIQMEEFGIGSALPEGVRRRKLVEALEKTGDLAGAERERAALVADGIPLE
jgi:tetratricopeptide (TPR) repeat protein